MKIFVTGASGFIGSAVVAELLAHGHDVTGLARSESAAHRITSAGARAVPGDLGDPASLSRAASEADAVIHLAFHHDFTDYARGAHWDRQAIETIGDALAGSDRAFVVASGMAGIGQGRVLTEDDVVAPDSPRVSEPTLFALADRGIRASAVRLAPTVHGDGDHAFIPALIADARAAGISAYPGDGTNRWPAVHRLDAAALFRLAVEQAPSGTVLHGVDEEGIPVRTIADAIGKGLGFPTESATAEEFAARSGFIGAVFAMDIPASSALTRQRFGWRPTHPGLLADLAQGHYFTPVAA